MGWKLVAWHYCLSNTILISSWLYFRKRFLSQYHSWNCVSWPITVTKTVHVYIVFVYMVLVMLGCSNINDWDRKPVKIKRFRIEDLPIDTSFWLFVDEFTSLWLFVLCRTHLFFVEEKFFLKSKSIAFPLKKETFLK